MCGVAGSDKNNIIFPLKKTKQKDTVMTNKVQNKNIVCTNPLDRFV